MCYATERQLNELGSAVKEQNKARAKQLIDDLRKKIAEKADTAALKSAMDELRGALIVLQQDAQAAAAAAQAASAQAAGAQAGTAQGGGAGFGGGGGDAGSGGRNASRHQDDDDIVDVEVSAA